MKYITLVGDGMADYPLDELGNKTPLQAADTPNMDYIASNGKNGLLKTIPDDMGAGSDVANLSILGYNPREYYTGRGPLEAAGMGIKLDGEDLIFRCNLITEKDGMIADYSSGHITTDEVKPLIELLNERLGGDGVKFYLGISYRHILSLKESGDAVCVPPHDVIGHKIDDNLPSGSDSDILKRLIIKSRGILEGHEINKARESKGKNPANMIWPWGQGKTPGIPLFEDLHGVHGAVISAVYLIKGIGTCAGLDVIDVPGATGYLDTSYENKAKYAVKSLEERDFVFVHVEAPDEAAHMGDLKEKMKAIESFDEMVGWIMDGLDGSCKILVLPDHFTPISVKTHTREPVPFAVYSTEEEGDPVRSFDESSAENGSFGLIEGDQLMDAFIR
ncbi:MAG: cofactor-independent phosphoglycerate mutase [Halobacteriota archaeon]|nr:cofactor-independent phosphoglycerate mutase [Halobacteriota archaeon]